MYLLCSPRISANTQAQTKTDIYSVSMPKKEAEYASLLHPSFIRSVPRNRHHGIEPWLFSDRHLLALGYFHSKIRKPKSKTLGDLVNQFFDVVGGAGGLDFGLFF